MKRHQKSFIRHPIKKFKKGKKDVTDTYNDYWQKGQKLGYDRIHHQVPPSQSDKDAVQTVARDMSTGKKITWVVVVVIVIALMIWGAMQ